jgi:DNA-3-methyladenine glycosylase
MKEKTIIEWNKLQPSFYTRKDVVTIAKDLLGKVLVTRFDDVITAGIIVETEAYNGIIDKASHAYNNRRTNRTEIMYAEGGIAYVYLCYGIHHLFNVVTNVKDEPHAVLIRGIVPFAGEEKILERLRKTKFDKTFIQGPGVVTKALGISTKHTSTNLLKEEIFIADNWRKINNNEIIITPRIGVNYAEEDALLPYRFLLKEEIFKKK